MAGAHGKPAQGGVLRLMFAGLVVAVVLIGARELSRVDNERCGDTVLALQQTVRQLRIELGEHHARSRSNGAALPVGGGNSNGVRIAHRAQEGCPPPPRCPVCPVCAEADAAADELGAATEALEACQGERLRDQEAPQCVAMTAEEATREVEAALVAYQGLHVATPDRVKGVISVAMVQQQDQRHKQMFRRSLPGFLQLFKSRAQLYFAGDTGEGLYVDKAGTAGLVERVQARLAESQCGSKLKVGICTLARREARYMQEFLAHHVLLGFTVFVYHRPDDPADRFDTAQALAIEPFLATGRVVDVPFPGKGKIQLPAYRDFLQRGGMGMDWAAYTDVDEFWTLPKHQCIDDLLAEKAQQSAVSVRWRIFHAANVFHVPHGELLAEKHDTYFDSFHVKMLSRPQDTRAILIHSIRLEPGKAKGGLGHAEAYLAHYITRSLEDFLQKISRGGSNLGGGYPLFTDPRWNVPMGRGPLAVEGYWRFEEYASGEGCPRTDAVRLRYAAAIRHVLGLPARPK